AASPPPRSPSPGPPASASTPPAATPANAPAPAPWAPPTPSRPAPASPTRPTPSSKPSAPPPGPTRSAPSAPAAPWSSPAPPPATAPPHTELTRIVDHELTVIGSTIATREELTALLTFCTTTGTRPVIDHTFPLPRAADGFARLAGGHHFGKIVFTV